MTAADYLADVEARATKQATAYARMIDLGGGVGALGINEPAMFEDMLAWSNATENDHADTVLRLVAALRAVLDELDECDADIPQDPGNATARHIAKTMRAVIASALRGERAPGSATDATSARGEVRA